MMFNFHTQLVKSQSTKKGVMKSKFEKFEIKNILPPFCSMNSMGLRSTAWPFDRLAAMFAWRLRCISSWLKSNESCKKLKKKRKHVIHAEIPFFEPANHQGQLWKLEKAKIWPKGAKIVSKQFIGLGGFWHQDMKITGFGFSWENQVYFPCRKWCQLR